MLILPWTMVTSFEADKLLLLASVAVMVTVPKPVGCSTPVVSPMVAEPVPSSTLHVTLVRSAYDGTMSAIV